MIDKLKELTSICKKYDIRLEVTFLSNMLRLHFNTYSTVNIDYKIESYLLIDYSCKFIEIENYLDNVINIKEIKEFIRKEFKK